MTDQIEETTPEIPTERPRPKLQPRTISAPEESSEKVGAYFTNPKKKGLEFIRSGCYLLDCALGGGWPLGRMSNIIGDKSTGKTLLAIEACTNFAMQYPRGEIYYLEAEAAFDEEYAEALGMPVDRINFVGSEFKDYTIESWYEHLDSVLQQAKGSSQPILYIVDSLDALSDRAEKDRAIDAGSYGGGKPKKVGELFRRLAKEIEKTRLHLQIISQVRDNIGVMFGEKHVRTGGRAMDFYASQCLWLSQIKKLDKTVKKVKRVIGIRVKANCKKNKIGLPFREAEFPIMFGYGVDDITAMCEWLDTVGSLDEFEQYAVGRSKKAGDVADSIKSLPRPELRTVRKELEDIVEDTWIEIEERFMPTQGKY